MIFLPMMWLLRPSRIVGIDGMENPAEEIDQIMAKRREEKPLKKKTYKGVLKRYTSMADSAMKGAGY